jgi:hypothetical protein
MTTDLDSEVLLSFDPEAIERCYRVADILHDDFKAPYMEYALLGLSTESNPFHVVETPLLRGQSVTSASVKQPGRQVLRMRKEIETLSHRTQQQLLPIVFIHRHPSCCDASPTDETFLRGVFVDHVFTAIAFEEVRIVEATERHCDCPGMQRLFRESSVDGKGPVTLRNECGIAFSLIVNREREYRLYGVRKSMCPFCDRAEVHSVPARLASGPQGWISPLDRVLLQRRLERDIRNRISFERGSETTECIQ